VDRQIRAPLGGAMAAGMIYQDLPHQARGHRQKMQPILGIERPLVDQS
jgi:hypothetical protein